MKIIYETPEGGVAVVTPAPGKTVNQIVSNVVPSGANYSIVEDSVIPTNRRFRNAWQKSGTTVVVDVTKAKLIAVESLRNTALNVIKQCQEKTELGEAVVYTKQVLLAAYQTALSTLQSKQTISDIEYCVDQFSTVYEQN